MQTRPLKYGSRTIATSISIPSSVLKELDELCKQLNFTSKSELITNLIHESYLAQNDPILSVKRMEQKEKELEKQKAQLEEEARVMFGRSLREQRIFISELAEKENRVKMEKKKEIEELSNIKPLIQSHLVDFYKQNLPGEAPLSSALDDDLLCAWRKLPLKQRQRLMDRAKTKADIHRDNWGRWIRGQDLYR